MYCFVRDVAGKAGGAAAAFFMAASTYNMVHSQTARYYAYVMLGGILLTWFLYRCVTRGGGLQWLVFVPIYAFAIYIMATTNLAGG